MEGGGLRRRRSKCTARIVHCPPPSWKMRSGRICHGFDYLYVGVSVGVDVDVGRRLSISVVGGRKAQNIKLMNVEEEAPWPQRSLRLLSSSMFLGRRRYVLCLAIENGSGGLSVTVPFS